MAKTIVGLYDEHQEAKRARETLIDHDFKGSNVSLIDRNHGDSEDIIQSLVGAGVAEGDAKSYAEGVNRGGYLVFVKTDDDNASQAVSLMNQFHPVDLEHRMNTWRSEGEHSSKIRGRTSDERDRDSETKSSTEGIFDTDKERASSAGMVGKETTAGKDEDDVLMGRSEEEGKLPSNGDRSRQAGAKQQEKLEVTEEELHVGKRTVEGEGGIRARAYVTERPVEEDIRLREERVSVERRPVDKEVSGIEGDAFKEEELEFTEIHEEPVVEKRTRVVEEVILTKDVSERTETVKDTVRRKDVDIEELSSDFQSHYGQSYDGSSYSFDDYSKGYRFGANLASQPGYQDRDWQDVEPTAREHWEGTNKGTWEEFKDSIRYGFEKVSGRGREDEARPMA